MNKKRKDKYSSVSMLKHDMHRINHCNIDFRNAFGDDE